MASLPLVSCSPANSGSRSVIGWPILHGHIARRLISHRKYPRSQVLYLPPNLHCFRARKSISSGRPRCNKLNSSSSSSSSLHQIEMSSSEVAAQNDVVSSIVDGSHLRLPVLQAHCFELSFPELDQIFLFLAAYCLFPSNRYITAVVLDLCATKNLRWSS